MFINKFFCVHLFGALFVLFFMTPHMAMGADEKPPAVLIIDGSGSMWGRLNKREKIVIARSELARQIDLLRTRV